MLAETLLNPTTSHFEDSGENLQRILAQAQNPNEMFSSLINLGEGFSESFIITITEDAFNNSFIKVMEFIVTLNGDIHRFTTDSISYFVEDEDSADGLSVETTSPISLIVEELYQDYTAIDFYELCKFLVKEIDGQLALNHLATLREEINFLAQGGFSDGIFECETVDDVVDSLDLNNEGNNLGMAVDAVLSILSENIYDFVYNLFYNVTVHNAFGVLEKTFAEISVNQADCKILGDVVVVKNQ